MIPPRYKPQLVKAGPLVSARPPRRRGLNRRCDAAIRRASEDIDLALDDHQIIPTRDTAIALAAMGLCLLEEQGVARDVILRFCERVLDTPGIEDPRSHTGGT